MNEIWQQNKIRYFSAATSFWLLVSVGVSTMIALSIIIYAVHNLLTLHNVVAVSMPLFYTAIALQALIAVTLCYFQPKQKDTKSE